MQPDNQPARLARGEIGVGKFDPAIRARMRGRELGLGRHRHARRGNDRWLVQRDGAILGVAPVELGHDATPGNSDAPGPIAGGKAIVPPALDGKGLGPAPVQAFTIVGANDQARTAVGAAGRLDRKCRADCLTRGAGRPAFGLRSGSRRRVRAKRQAARGQHRPSRGCTLQQVSSCDFHEMDSVRPQIQSPDSP